MQSFGAKREKGGQGKIQEQVRIIKEGWGRGGSRCSGKHMGNGEIKKSEIYDESRN